MKLRYYIKNFLISTLLSLLAISFAHADRNDKPGVIKRRYTHVCPAGTEQVGDGPPKSSIIFCRQITNNGYSLEGEYVTFFPNGNKKTEGTYLNGKKNGTWKVYSKYGDVLETREFNEGLVKKKNLSYAKKNQTEAPQKTRQTGLFHQDREVLNSLRVSKTKYNKKSSGKHYVYGISGK